MSRLFARLRGTAPSPVDPPDPGDYLPGVIAAGGGLQAVWNLRNTAGLSGPLTKNLPGDSALLPAGSSTSTGPNELFLPNSGAAYTVQDFGLLGHEVHMRAGAAQAILRNARLYNPGGGRLIEVETGADALFEDVELDSTGVSNIRATGVALGGGATHVVMRRVKSFGGSVSGVMVYSANTEWEDCFLGSYGLNPSPDPHMEPIFFFRGTHVIDQMLIDPTDELAAGGGTTALIYIEAGSTGSGLGNTEVTINRSILRGCGPAHLNIYSAIQIAAKGYNAKLTIKDSAIERGTHAGKPYALPSESNGGVVTIVDGGGNYDLNSGEPIILTK